MKGQLIHGKKGGTFRVLELISNSMQPTYLAFRIQDSRLAVVKLPGDDDGKAAYFREADLLDRLSHSQIVKKIDYRRWGHEPCVITLYVPGNTLQSLLKEKKKISPSKCKRLFVQICEAIEAVHKKGIIHRDLKPHNIIVHPKNKPVLIDFGLAFHPDLAEFEIDDIIGSPLYVSPEEIMGLDFDERMDIYSIGICMYQALTGSPPYLGRSPGEVMIQHCRDDPIPLRNFSRKISRELEAVVLKAIAKKPEDRFDNATEFRNAIIRAADESVRYITLPNRELEYSARLVS